jgi:hypothetical protein
LFDCLIFELRGIFRALHLRFSISVFDIIICLLIWGNANTNSGALIQNVGLVDGSVHSNASLGGLVGSNSGTIKNSHATSNIRGQYAVGGLVGLNSGTISNSYATGSVTTSDAGIGSQVGGLVGYNSGTIDNSYSNGGVRGPSEVGGLVGGNYGWISNSYATGNVSGYGTNAYFGGLAGFNSGSISNSYAEGDVTSTGNNVGGLVGYNSYGSIVNSYAKGNVISSNGFAIGGLVGGNLNSTISSSYATGNVTGSVTGGSQVGGLVGGNYGTISNSYATGNVTNDFYVGGLVGSNGGSISNSYATGSVTSSVIGGDNSNFYVGGLVGHSYGDISSSYATGSVIGNGYIYGYFGGLAGSNSGSISNSYWNTTNNPSLPGVGRGNASGATGLTTQQMQVASNFSGFIFTTTPGAAGWVIVDTDGSLNNASGTGATSPILASEYATSIVNAHQLQLMVMAQSGSYTLGTNIDASTTAGGDVWGNASTGFNPTFTPVGSGLTPFTGKFDGLGHTISGLTINPPNLPNVAIAVRSNSGLFGATSAEALIQNVGMVGGYVNSGASFQYVGGLVGYNAGTINNSFATGLVAGDSGSNYVGGLVGYNTGSINNSSESPRVSWRPVGLSQTDMTA